MNGATIGLALTVLHRRTIPQGLLREKTVFAVAVAGIAMRGIAVFLFVAATLLRVATTMLVFACFASHSLKLGHLYMASRSIQKTCE